MSKLIELEYNHYMNEDSKTIYNNKMQIVALAEYETLVARKKAYQESYFDADSRDLDELDKQGNLLCMFSNEDENGGSAYYLSEPLEFEPDSKYQFFRELIQFGKGSTFQYREIDLNEVIYKYKKFRSEDEYLTLQTKVLDRYNVTEDDIQHSPLKEYMSHLYRHVKVLEDNSLITLKFNGEGELTGIKVETVTSQKQGFTRGR